MDRWLKPPCHFDGDLAAGPLYSDRLPTRGLAGWADWLLDGPIAKALATRKLRFTPGEKLLLATRPPFTPPKVLLFSFTAPVLDQFGAVAETYAQAILGLGARRVLVEPPCPAPAEAFAARLTERLFGTVELFFYFAEEPCRI